MAEFKRMDEVDLPPAHPAAADGRGPAYACGDCGGIFFPIGEPTNCPYCEEDDDE